MSKRLSTTRQVMHALEHHIQGKTLDAGGGPRAKYKSIIIRHATKYVCMDAQGGGDVDVVGDLAAMPFQDGSFDTVVCNQVLEHVPRPAVVMHEIARVLTRGGQVIATAPFWEPIHSDPGDYFRYTKEGIAALAVDAGLEVVQVQSYGGFFAIIFSALKFRWFNPYLPQTRLKRRLARRLEWVFLTMDGWFVPGRIYSDVYLLARKPGSSCKS